MTKVRIWVSAAYIVWTQVILLFLALACSRAAALHSDRSIAQFAHTAWGPKDSAPSVVRALAQSTDGYLWLGTPDGLYRFDGVVFERYQPQSGGPFPARDVFSLLALPNGDLWIGFRGAISLLRNGNVTNYTTRDGLPWGGVWGFAQDRKGTIWAATESGLARLENNRWKEVGKDWNFPGKTAFAVFVDRQGTLWVSTEDTLVFLYPGARRFQPTGIRVGQVLQIRHAPSGKLWMAETTRSVRPIPLSDKRLPPDSTEVHVGSSGILFDNNGALWITTVGDGVRRAPAPELLQENVEEFSSAVESFTAKDGLSDDYVRTILQDREGNIWVGTNSGLDRFRKTNVVPLVIPFKPHFAALAAGDAGEAWVQNIDLMVRVHGGRADPGHLFPDQALSAYRDLSGAIWWLCLDAIYRYNAGNYTRVAYPPSFSKPHTASILATEDGSGVLWLNAEREGLFYRKKRGWQQLKTASELAKLPPKAAFTDWMGRAWFGYEEGTIILLKDESIQKVFPAGDCPVGGVRAINGRGRHTWVGGELGLAFFDGNRFRRIIPTDAEAFGLVLGVEETSDGGLWLSESRGVIQIPASEVQQALENPSYRVKYRIFDSFDGLPGTFAGIVNSSKEFRGTDGRLWFAASDGIAWVDPANISTNLLPPPVLIRSVKANGRQFDTLTHLVLPPRTTDLQISYTALSLSVPEKVHFRYRLEGVDKDWQDAGTRREAFYTRLGPGKYHFRVLACNSDGVWNEEGAHLDVNIAPAWYQTNVFRLLCVATVLLALWSLYQLRLRRMAALYQGRMEERLAERQRIAQDLHDTLLQSVQGMILKLYALTTRIPPGDATRQKIEKALEQAGEAVKEGRDRIENLRTTVASRDNLPAALQRVAEEISPGNEMCFKMLVEGVALELHPMVLEESYYIGREALINAFRHSDGLHIEVQITYHPRQLRLRVCDDGRGIDPAILEKGRENHWGLTGMRERAQRIGAEVQLSSRRGVGTEVELTVPGATAYRAWLWWKYFRRTE